VLPGMLPSGRPGSPRTPEPVGWAERSEPHRDPPGMVGLAALGPPYYLAYPTDAPLESPLIPDPVKPGRFPPPPLWGGGTTDRIHGIGNRVPRAPEGCDGAMSAVNARPSIRPDRRPRGRRA